MQTVRDLELANEDTKGLEQMYAKVIDEETATQLKLLQQAFVSGGDIMHNILSMH